MDGCEAVDCSEDENFRRCVIQQCAGRVIILLL